ncbi:hypothetical protein [Mycolicibacillus trivialis]|uniref:Uncharacterized protein n=1 Tax=Mycolicibacillus trivialis TaxID=1798 RepID=A0A1X2ELU8_9MYCO|nr:hypothetical protein [Mycolicibacillus trivialis]ORX06154.1 hypothetical protein AWC30_07040 [Mycolicibacillus trivialis]
MSNNARPTPRPARVGPRVPADWTPLRWGGPPPFVSWVTYRLPDGSEYTWRARPHRKRTGPLLLSADRAGLRTGEGQPADATSPWRRFWAPHRLAWWLALVFTVGSALFVAGAAGSLVPAFFGGQHPMSVFAESCYFAGAVLFTVALYGVLLEALNTDERIGPEGDNPAPRRFRWSPAPADLTRLEVLIPVVFLAGSLIFNYETTDSLASLFDLLPRLGLWQTTMIGSVFFLLGSMLQFIEAGNHYLSVEPRDISWWIGVLFILGSVGFVIGSLPGLGTPGVPDAHADAGALIVKIGFLSGGVAYLAGSYLMLPEMFSHLRPESTVRPS